MTAIPGLFSRFIFSSQPAAPEKELLVVLFLRGAMDGLNVIIPYAEDEYYRLRPTIGVARPKTGDSKTAIDLDGFFGLHPALEPLKPFWDAKQAAFIHACGSHDPTHSHFDAMSIMERAAAGQASLQTGWVARHLSAGASGAGDTFRSVTTSTMIPISQRGYNRTLAIPSLAGFRLGGNRAAGLKDVLPLFYQGTSLLDIQARETLAAVEKLSKLSLDDYQPAGGAKYPASKLAQSLKLVALLAKSGTGLEVVTMDAGGWDTHVQEGSTGQGRLPALLSELSVALAAFLTDMKPLLDRLTLVWMSEFGRRAQENGNGGTDHGHGNVMAVVSGKANGGKVYGKWPGLKSDALYGPGDLAVTTDYRLVLAEIVQKRLGNANLDSVFPGFTDRGYLGLF